MTLTLVAAHTAAEIVCSETTICGETTIVDDGLVNAVLSAGSLTYTAMNEGSLSLTAIVGSGGAYGGGSYGSGSYGSGGGGATLTFTPVSEGSLTLTPA